MHVSFKITLRVIHFLINTRMIFADSIIEIGVNEEMKKLLVLAISLLLLLPLAGCGVKQKIADKVGEKVAEGVAGKILGDDVDVDVDGDKVTIKGDDGTEWSMGEGEWPADKAGALLPEFKKGKISSVLNSEEGCWVTIEEVEEEDYLHYVEALKTAGYVDDAYTASGGEDLSYTAQMEGKASVSASFHSGTMMITLSLQEEEE